MKDGLIEVGDFIYEESHSGVGRRKVIRCTKTQAITSQIGRFKRKIVSGNRVYPVHRMEYQRIIYTVFNSDGDSELDRKILKQNYCRKISHVRWINLSLDELKKIFIVLDGSNAFKSDFEMACEAQELKKGGR